MSSNMQFASPSNSQENSQPGTQAHLVSPLQSQLKSWIPLLLTRLEESPAMAFENKNLNFVLRESTAFALGIATLALLAKISFVLPFTPVPITGQTFGVASIALLWGRSRGSAIVLSYLIFGAMGLPFFAGGASGLLLGPTSGYLIGMFLSSFVIGSLADRGWSLSLHKAWLAATIGSILVFSSGLLVLSRFVPRDALLMSGLFPFIPGDLLKNLLAATIASQVTKKLSHQSQP